MTKRRLLAAATTAVALALVAGVLVVALRSPSTYVVHARFTSADGLFAGNTVESLGVPVGTVEGVESSGDTVLVTMAIQSGHVLPRRASAALVSPQLLGEPSVELTPGYAGGPALPAGATIPLSRTSVPVSTDQLLKDLQSFLSQINPHQTGSLVTNLAADLTGEGAGLHALVGNAAGTLRLLAAKGNDLGQLEGTLARITGTLRSQTSLITSLIENYDTVSGVVASHSTQLGAAVTDLATANTQLSNLLTPNLGPIESDVAGITRVGRTVSRNLASIDQLLSSAVLLFAATERSFDPKNNWINLNNQLAPGLTAANVAGLLRDQLAGICRRIAANHSTGLSASELSTLATCGNPSSGFFDPLLGLIPEITNALTSGPDGGPSPAALETMFSHGLAMIPGISSLKLPAAGSSTSTAAPATGSGSSPASSPSSPSSTTSSAAPSLTAPAASQLPPMPSAPSGSGSTSSGGVSGLLSGLLGGL
ncbi:MAG: MCE family protein [Actinomycetota bacterium]|nr:MCE family protein [Actinomycetota bacterium]